MIWSDKLGDYLVVHGFRDGGARAVFREGKLSLFWPSELGQPPRPESVENWERETPPSLEQRDLNQIIAELKAMVVRFEQLMALLPEIETKLE